jgi:hypothetical protein
MATVARIAFIATGASFAYVAFRAATFAPTDTSHPLGPVALVTVAWWLMLWTFLFWQSASHSDAFVRLVRETVRSEKDKPKSARTIIDKSRLKRGGYDLPEVDAANTLVRNTMEQSLSFLPLLWMAALFAGPGAAATGGWAWVLSRCIYPFVCGRVGSPLLYLSTVPGYAAQVYLASHVLSSI